MVQGKKRMSRSPRLDRAPQAVEALEVRRLLSGSASCLLMAAATPAVTTASAAATIQGLAPDQVAQTYGLDQVPGDGTGQTIAIVEAYNDPNIHNDLSTFDSQFGLPEAESFAVVSQSGGDAGAIA